MLPYEKQLVEVLKENGGHRKRHVQKAVVGMGEMVWLKNTNHLWIDK